MTTLEQQVRMRWLVWAVYRQHGICSGCGQFVAVGRANRRQGWLCVGCFDQR